MRDYHYHHRDRAGGFDMGYLVPGLAFFDELAGNLCDALERAFKLIGEACRSTRQRFAKGRRSRQD